MSDNDSNLSMEWLRSMLSFISVSCSVGKLRQCMISWNLTHSTAWFSFSVSSSTVLPVPLWLVTDNDSCGTKTDKTYYEPQLIQNTYSCHFFRQAILTRKVGHGDLVLVCDQGSLVGLCMQDYKSLCAAVTVCSTLVNIQTRRQTDRQTDIHWRRITNASFKRKVFSQK